MMMEATNLPRNPTSMRLASVESYRVVAILIVVFLHANFIARLHVVGGAYGFVLDLPLYLLFWISVPYFFLAAGYFYGLKVRAGYDPRVLLDHSCRSLLIVFVIWVLVYSVITRYWITAFYEQGIWHTLSTEAAHTGARLLSEHVKLLLIPRPPLYHLWFLPTLIVGLGTVTVVITSRLGRIAGSLVLLLYGLTVACDVIPSDVLRTYPPRMFLLGMVFTLLGWWISQQKAASSSLAVGLMAGGFLLAVAEGVALKLLFHASTVRVASYPYAGAVLLVLGIFLFTLAKPTLGQSTFLPTLARFTLGVYVSHILIEHTLAPLHDQLPHISAVWHFCYAIAVYGLSVLLTWGFSHLPVLRASVLREKSPTVILNVSASGIETSSVPH